MSSFGSKLASACAAGLLAWPVGTPALAQTQETREHVQQITSAPASYSVETRGAVWNREVRIENVGDTAVTGIRLTVNGRDWSTLDRILARILAPGMTEEQKARAIWQFARSSSYHWWPVSDWSAEFQQEPVRYFHSYGYGFCGDIAVVMAAMFHRAGLPARLWNPGTPTNGHVVPEAFYDGRWHMFDADRDGLYLLRDNETVAGVEDLIADPWLVARAGPAHADLVDLYAATPPTALMSWWTPPLGGLDVEVTSSLRPGEQLTWRWSHEGYHRDDTDYAAPQPPSFANGELRSTLRAADPRWQQWVDRAQGVQVRDTAAGPAFVASGAELGEIVYRVESAYPVLHAEIEADIVRQTDGEIVIAASRFVDAIRLQGSDLIARQYRVPGIFVDEANLATAREDGALPLLHTWRAWDPAWITYRLVRDGVRPLTLRGLFYRSSWWDTLWVDVSADGQSWLRAWQVQDDQLDYFTQEVDLTPYVPPDGTIYVRLGLLAGLAPHAFWTVGVKELSIEGLLVPIASEAWRASADGRVGAFTTTVDLSPIVAPARGSATYRYAVLLRVEPGAESLGVSAIRLRSVTQMASVGLPALVSGSNTVEVTRDQGEGGALQVVHVWDELAGSHAPTAPDAPLQPASGTTLVRSPVLSLSWKQADDAEGDVVGYQVVVCSDVSCTSPLSSIFDVFVPGATAALWSGEAMSWFSDGRTYFWRVRALDATGLWSEFSPTWSFVVRDPASLPRLSLAVPAEMSSVSPFVSISGMASGTDIVEVRWATDRGARGTAAGTTSWRASNIPVGRGATRIVVTVRDRLGAEASASVTVLVEEYRYLLAEGATGPFFTTHLAIANPEGEDARVAVRFMTDAGRVLTHDVVVPARRRITIDIGELPGLENAQVSTEVVSLDAVPLLVERTMFWDRTWYGGHSSTAVSEARTAWYFAEGSQGFFDTWILVVNPDSRDADVHFTFMTEAGEVVETEVAVPAGARHTLYAGSLPALAGRSFTLTVVASVPIVAERAMYFGTARFWEGGHASAGSPELSTDWYFAEGATGPFFDTYLLVGNPGSEPAHLSITFLTGEGQTIVKPYVVGPRSRLTVNVEEQDPALRDAAVSSVLTADVPIVAERAMYWPGAPTEWADGHSASGRLQEGTRWGVADGRTGGPPAFETFLLIANRHDAPAEIRATFLPERGEPVQRSFVVAPRSRFTLWVNTMVPELPEGTFGVLLESTNGVPIVAERALYWSGGTPWGGGAAAPAIPLP